MKKKKFNKKLLVASNNKNKVFEIKTLLSSYFKEIVSLRDENIDIDVEETGTTFFENALIKAKTIAKMANMVTISDDSGICVDALNNAPGVYSARFAGKNSTDKKNNDLLLDNLKNEVNRDAFYMASIVVYFPETDTYIESSGKTYGKILTKPDGKGGFGYDPIFFSTELNKTFANCTIEEKNKVSHRARALAKIVEQLN